MTNMKLTFETLIIKYIPDLKIADTLATGLIAQTKLILREEITKKIAELSHEEILKMGYVKKDDLDSSDNTPVIP